MCLFRGRLDEYYGLMRFHCAFCEAVLLTSECQGRLCRCVPYNRLLPHTTLYGYPPINLTVYQKIGGLFIFEIATKCQNRCRGIDRACDLHHQGLKLLPANSICTSVYKDNRWEHSGKTLRSLFCSTLHSSANLLFSSSSVSSPRSD